MQHLPSLIVLMLCSSGNFKLKKQKLIVSKSLLDLLHRLRRAASVMSQ